MDSSAPTQSPQSTRKPTPAEIRRAGKNERRNAAREAQRRQEAARRQRNALLGAFAAVVIVIGGVFLLTHLGSKKAKTPAAAASAPVVGAQPAPSAAASATAAPTPSGPPFPGVAAGENAGLKTQPTIKAGTGTVSKLVVTTLIAGKGPVVKAGDNIVVNYIGATYKDGKVFDSSWSRKQTFPTAIGTGAVIPGWDKGLVGVKVGSRVQLDIPAAQAYGTNPTGGQPAGDLRFIVDILSDSGAAS